MNNELRSVLNEHGFSFIRPSDPEGSRIVQGDEVPEKCDEKRIGNGKADVYKGYWTTNQNDRQMTRYVVLKIQSKEKAVKEEQVTVRLNEESLDLYVNLLGSFDVDDPRVSKEHAGLAGTSSNQNTTMNSSKRCLVLERAICSLESLLQRPSRHDGLLPEELFELIRSLSQAVEVMINKANLFHRDIKPANILVFDAGTGAPSRYKFKLADFNSAVFIPPNDTDDMVGTPGYMHSDLEIQYANDRKSRKLPKRMELRILEAWMVATTILHACIGIQPFPRTDLNWSAIVEMYNGRNKSENRRKKSTINEIIARCIDDRFRYYPHIRSEYLTRPERVNISQYVSMLMSDKAPPPLYGDPARRAINLATETTAQALIIFHIAEHDQWDAKLLKTTEMPRLLKDLCIFSDKAVFIMKRKTTHLLTEENLKGELARLAWEGVNVIYANVPYRIRPYLTVDWYDEPPRKPVSGCLATENVRSIQNAYNKRMQLSGALAQFIEAAQNHFSEVSTMWNNVQKDVDEVRNTPEVVSDVEDIEEKCMEAEYTMIELQRTFSKVLGCEDVVLTELKELRGQMKSHFQRRGDENVTIETSERLKNTLVSSNENLEQSMDFPSLAQFIMNIHRGYAGLNDMMDKLCKIKKKMPHESQEQPPPTADTEQASGSKQLIPSLSAPSNNNAEGSQSIQ